MSDFATYVPAYSCPPPPPPSASATATGTADTTTTASGGGSVDKKGTFNAATSTAPQPTPEVGTSGWFNAKPSRYVAGSIRTMLIGVMNAKASDYVLIAPDQKHVVILAGDFQSRDARDIVATQTPAANALYHIDVEGKWQIIPSNTPEYQKLYTRLSPSAANATTGASTAAATTADDSTYTTGAHLCDRCGSRWEGNDSTCIACGDTGPAGASAGASAAAPPPSQSQADSARRERARQLANYDRFNGKK